MTVINNANLTNLLHRQIKWLTSTEVASLAEQLDYEDGTLNGGWSFCHYIVHQGYMKPFVTFCKHKYDALVKNRQNPPKERIKDVFIRTVDTGSNKCLDSEKLDIFARSVDWELYSEFQKQRGIKNRELTNDEKYDIIVARFQKTSLDKKIMDSWRWRTFWLKAIDDVYAEIAAEEDPYWGYGF